MKAEVSRQPVLDGIASQLGSASGQVVISACVIGRNEAEHLRNCGQSLRALATLGYPFETLYVDSCSTDRSIDVALEVFDRVISLKSSPHLNASAGRHVATLAARGAWIIYLDGDMTLRPEFLPELARLIAAGRSDCGVVGKLLHVYPDGRSRPQIFRGNRDGAPCRAFGGSAVLPRMAVLKAGNWNARLYSNEEIELYGRLRNSGSSVVYREIPFTDHHTDFISGSRMLLGLLWPAGSVLGKKFYGLGQVIRASWHGGTLFAFLRAKPEPFVFLLGVLASLVLFSMGNWPIALAALIAALAVAIRAGGLKGPIFYLTWLPQILFGLFRYPRDFEPQIERELAGRQDSPDAARR